MHDEQPPHIEVMSRNKVNRSTIIVALPFTIGFAGVLVAAIWPHLAEVWLMVEFILFVLALCLAAAAIILVSYLYHRSRLHLAHLDRQSRLLTWSDGAAWHGDDGSMVHLSAQLAEASRPLMLAAPPAAKPPEPDHSADIATILEMHSHGTGHKSIAASFKDCDPHTWVTEHQVRRICNEHDAAEYAKERERLHHGE